MKRFYSLFLLVACAALIVTPANARKKYATAEGKSCAYCHTTAAGGGPRNYRGAFYEKNNLTFASFDDAAEAKKANVPVGPDATPNPKSYTAPLPAPPPQEKIDFTAIPDFGTVTVYGIEFVKIPAGTYTRGTSPAEQAQLEKLGYWNKLLNKVELPAREVRITKPFLISKCEISQAQWLTVMGGANPSAFKNNNNPVDSVSFTDAQNFTKTLKEKAGGTFRLPTEAEWEYVARAGKPNAPFGTARDGTPLTPETLKTAVWMNGTANNKTQPIGTRGTNPWGVSDMLGNVWEWCADGYGSDAYTQPETTNPLYRNPNTTERVLRGGCWFLDARSQRVALRGGALPNTKNQYVGFRIVRDLP